MLTLKVDHEVRQFPKGEVSLLAGPMPHQVKVLDGLADPGKGKAYMIPEVEGARVVPHARLLKLGEEAGKENLILHGIIRHFEKSIEQTVEIFLVSTSGLAPGSVEKLITYFQEFELKPHQTVVIFLDWELYIELYKANFTKVFAISELEKNEKPENNFQIKMKG